MLCIVLHMTSCKQHPSAQSAAFSIANERLVSGVMRRTRMLKTVVQGAQRAQHSVRPRIHKQHCRKMEHDWRVL